MPNTNHARPEDRKRVAAEIQRRRIDLGYTQEQLANASGVSLRTVQNAETAEAVLSPLSRAKLEKALNLPAGHLTELYVSDGESNDGHHEGVVGTLLSPEITGILDHPDLTPEMRRVIIEQLHREHERFARRAVEFFGLNGPHHQE